MNLDKLLKYDPIQEAEDSVYKSEIYTGLSDREKRDTISGIALMNVQMAAEMKRQLLTKLDDTHFGVKFSKFIGIANRVGFKVAYHRPFLYENHIEKEIILYNYDTGCLIFAESYRETGLNSCYMYYNLAIKEGREFFNHTTSSGHYLYFHFFPSGELSTRVYPKQHFGEYIWPVWSGNYDCRQGMVHHLNKLSEYYDFMPTWYEKPTLWFVNFAESENIRLRKIKYEPGYSPYDNVTQSKIEQLDPVIRDRIKGIEYLKTAPRFKRSRRWLLNS